MAFWDDLWAGPPMFGGAQNMAFTPFVSQPRIPGINLPPVYVEPGRAAFLPNKPGFAPPLPYDPGPRIGMEDYRHPDDVSPDVAKKYDEATRIRIDKPTWVQPSATTSSAPEATIPNTLPYINSAPYAQSAAPAASSTPARKPFDWGPDASLWPMLMAAGQGMMQPSWYGLGGQITQGLGAASEAAQKAPMQRAQRRLLEAQVGEVESKAAARAGLRDFATRANLPKAVALALQLSPEKAADILEKYDPAMKAAYLQFVEEKSGATAKGSFPYDVAKAAAGATNISVKMATETQARHDLLQKYREAANRETDPQKRATLTAQADSLERQITIGEKQFPEHYLKAARNLSEATAAAAEAVKLLSDPNVSRFNFDDRAKIRQQVEAVRLAYADLKNRGANFTEQEQKMIEALYRGDPLKWTDMPLRSRQSYIEGMRIAHAAMVREWNSIERAFMTGRPSITPLPVPNTGPTTPPPPPGFRPLR